MKCRLAFIPPDFRHRIKDALTGRHLHGMSVSDARGFGQEHDATNPEHREFMGLDLPKRVRVEIICHDEEVELLLDAIYKAGRTGHAGDGKVFVLPALDALRLKTGERGLAALGLPAK
jgi:nitrogen regulatory protein P-II 1